MSSSQPATHASLAERYRVLLEIGATLTGTLGLRDLYREIFEQSSRVLQIDGFYISRYDPKLDEACIVFFVDDGKEQMADLSYPGASSTVIREDRAVLIADELESHSVMLLGEDESRVTRSGISAPLRCKGRVIGALSVQSYETGTYSEEDLDLLQGIADLAAVAIENAHHIEKLERRLEEAHRIAEMGRALATSLVPQDVRGKVIESTLELVRADGATVWMIEGSRAKVAAAAGSIPLPIGLEWDLTGPLFEALVHRREVAGISDLATSELVPEHLRGKLEAGSGMAVPLVVGGSVAGALTAGSRDTGAFDKDTERIMMSLSAQAAVALENARLHASLQALSLTDPLTGLPNRRHLEIHLRREVAAARRGRQVVLVIFDLDDFKGYNDSRGHLAGDDALRAFGQVLSEENRAMNLVARYGGDEFISVLSESHMEGAVMYVDRVRAAMARNAILHEGQVRVSAGLAMFDPDIMRSGDELLQAADEDLYSHKSARARRRS